MAEIGMRHAEGNIQLARGFDEFIGFLEIQAERLFAKDCDAGFHGLHRRIKVNEVGSDDEDVIQLLLLGQRFIRRDHVVICAITSDRVRPLCRFLERDFGIGKQRARHHATGAVKMDGFLMRIDDEGAFATADESDIERSV